MTGNKTQNKSFPELFMHTYNKIIVALLNRFLYLTITIVLFLCTTSLWNYSEMGQVVYLTVPTSLIGSRPCRLWGILSLVNMSLIQVRIVIFSITLIITLCTSLPLYYFVRDIHIERNKIFPIFGIGLILILFIFNYKYMLWDYASLSLYIAFMLVCWSVFFLLKTENKIISVLFTLIAELVDCRTIFFLLPIVLSVIFIKRIHHENKHLKIINLFIISVAAIVLVFSFLYHDFDYVVDEDSIDKVFTERFIEENEDIVDEKDIDKSAWAFKFNAYLRVSPQELIGDSITNIFYIKDIVYEDNFQLIILLFLVTILLYDHKDDYNENLPDTENFHSTPPIMTI